MALTGTRIEEALHARWGDIGREENGEAVLYIRKSKTRAGKRAIPLFSEMAHELKVRRLASPHSMGDI